MNPATILYLRKQAAVPLYWLAGKFLTLANLVDGPQPRKAKTPREISKRIYEMPPATPEQMAEIFKGVDLSKSDV